MTAPESIRVERILKRDPITRKEVQSRMDNQWPDEKKIPLASFVIENTNLAETKKQVKDIHHRILKG